MNNLSIPEGAEPFYFFAWKIMFQLFDFLFPLTRHPLQWLFLKNPNFWFLFVEGKGNGGWVGVYQELDGRVHFHS